MDAGVPLTSATPTSSDEDRAAAARRRLHDTMLTVGRGSTVMVVTTIAFVLLQFLARIAAIRVISLTEWGEFSIALALTSVLALLAAVGLPTAVARALAYEGEPEARWKIIRPVTSVMLASAGAGTAIVFVAAPYLSSLFSDPNLTWVFQLFSITIAFGVLSGILAGFFQGVDQVGPNAYFNQVLNPLLFLVFVVAAIAFHWGFAGVVWAYVASQGLAFAAIAVYTVRKLPKAIETAPRAEKEPDPSGRVPLKELAFTLFGVRAFVFITGYADTLVLGYFRPDTLYPDVGLYTAAMTVARLFLIGNTAVTFIFLPVTSRLRRDQDFETFRRSYVTSTRWVMVLAVPMFIVFFFEPRATLLFVFAPHFKDAALALQILVVGSFGAVLLGPSNSALAGMGHPKSNLRITGVSAAADLVLSFGLIPFFGLVGAAIAWAVARLLYPGLCLVKLWQLYRVNPFVSRLVRPVAIGLVVLAALFLVVFSSPSPWLMPLTLLLALGIYLAILLATKGIEQADLIGLGMFEKMIGRRLPRVRATMIRFQDPAEKTPPPA